jgi:hypothetical protein
MPKSVVPVIVTNRPIKDIRGKIKLIRDSVMDYLVTVGPVRKNFLRPPGNLWGVGGNATTFFHKQHWQAGFAGRRGFQLFEKVPRP